MGGCLLYGCHTQQEKGENGSKYTADPQSIVRQDTLPLPVDTHAASSVSTEGWTAKQIRDSIELFFGKEYDTLPPHLRKIRRNMASLWNTDDSVFLQLIIAEAPYIKAFKTYVFDSPLIRIGGGPYDRSPEESLREDTTHFSMRVSPNVYPTNIERIEIAITNHTALEGMGGESYFIEHFDGKAWKGVPQPNFFIDIGYPIFPNETRDDFSAPYCQSSRKTLRDCTGCARPSSPDRAPVSSIILWPPRSTYPITRRIMRNTHASPAGSTSLAPWPSSREEEKP